MPFLCRCLLSCAVFISWLAGVFGFAVSAVAQGEIIYQAFEEPFADLAQRVESLRSMGFTTIQISPPQKSLPAQEWWARYQPVDYRVIEGPLGDEEDLRRLFAAGKESGVRIIVDAVLNHMASARRFPDLKYPQFSPWDFHYSDSRPCIENYGDRFQVTHYWLCDYRASLPDLDTSSPYVRQVHLEYLRKLLDLGAAGFRFDGAKHIEPEYFAAIVPTLPVEVQRQSYGEVIGQNVDESGIYTRYLRVSDFHLLGTMISAFGVGGDLRALKHPQSYGGALADKVAVTMARNHDSAMNPGFFQFSDYQDALLANGFILARRDGRPMIFNGDAYQRIVRAGLKFRRAMDGEPEYFRGGSEVCGAACESPNLLFIERGSRGLAIINKASTWLDVGAARFPGLQTGCYHELNYGFRMEIAAGGDGQSWVSAWGSAQRGGLNVGPRVAMFFERVDCGSNSHQMQ